MARFTNKAYGEPANKRTGNHSGEGPFVLGIIRAIDVFVAVWFVIVRTPSAIGPVEGRSTALLLQGLQLRQYAAALKLYADSPKDLGLLALLPVAVAVLVTILLYIFDRLVYFVGDFFPPFVIWQGSSVQFMSDYFKRELWMLLPELQESPYHLS